MRRILVYLLLFVGFLANAFGQGSDANSPATKEDVARYFEVVHSRQMIDQMTAVMSKSIHQMTRDRYLKNKDKLPPDFDDRESKHVDQMFKDMPWDEMMQAMIPAYQRHFTKGDIDTLIAFYSSPAGQKLLHELPAILSESMQAMTPILERYTETVKQKVNDEFAQALKQSNNKPN